MSEKTTSYNQPAEVDRSSGFHFFEVHAPSTGLSWTYVVMVLLCLMLCYGMYRCFVFKCSHPHPAQHSSALEELLVQNLQRSLPRSPPPLIEQRLLNSTGLPRRERRFATMLDLDVELAQDAQRFHPPCSSSPLPSRHEASASAPPAIELRDAATQMSLISQC